MKEWPEAFDDEGFAVSGGDLEMCASNFEDLIASFTAEEKRTLGCALTKIMVNSLNGQLKLLREIERIQRENRPPIEQ